ncbi:MAG TPA: hypothetical protein VFN60_09375, partial [Acidimicrobiales bacterium]|nr:hypothetical protein [Acidimicrobiales bacterium]
MAAILSLLTFGVVPPPAGASEPPAVAEKVIVAWPGTIGSLSLARGAKTFELTLRSEEGDAPISVSDLSLDGPGLPIRAYLDPTSLVLLPGRAAAVQVTVAAISTTQGSALPAQGRLRLAATLHTRTVTTTLSDDLLFGNG